MTNAIGVAETAIANRPAASDTPQVPSFTTHPRFRATLPSTSVLSTNATSHTALSSLCPVFGRVRALGSFLLTTTTTALGSGVFLWATSDK